MPKKFLYGLGAFRDAEDLEDYSYSVTMAQVLREIGELPVRVNNVDECTPVWNQGTEGSCVGMAVAGAAEFLYWKKLATRPQFSPRAAYEWAKRHDYIPGNDHEGSTLRGGLKAWDKMGMCPWHFWPYQDNKPGVENAEARVRARKYPLWRYERLDGHNQARHAIHRHGIILATLQVHTGWADPSKTTGCVPYRSNYVRHGLHAVCLVGYDQRAGYWLVRNSWGIDWSTGGYAWLKYDDYADNVVDVWLPVIKMD